MTKQEEKKRNRLLWLLLALLALLALLWKWLFPKKVAVPKTVAASLPEPVITPYGGNGAATTVGGEFAPEEFTNEFNIGEEIIS